MATTKSDNGDDADGEGQRRRRRVQCYERRRSFLLNLDNDDDGGKGRLQLALVIVVVVLASVLVVLRSGEKLCTPSFTSLGCKPMEHMDIVGGSASASPCSSSYQPSPCASYNPSPPSSSFHSPVSSRYAANAISNSDANSLIPWLKNLSSSSSKLPHHLFAHGGSISAPVTPPLSSPTSRTPRITDNWDDPGWAGHHLTFIPSSTPPSPGRQTPPDSGWHSGIQTPQDGPSSPMFSLVSSNPFGFKDVLSGSGGGSRMWTPGQSGTCSPVVAAGVDQTADIPMSDGIATEFAFGSNTKGLVKAWEGERIHEECVADDLELTLGNPRTR
ncbi:BES1/BZR1 protein 4 [Sarracenia purpurea var. burkii]